MPHIPNILDDNGWPSEPDAGAKRLRPFKRHTKQEKMAIDKDTKEPESLELENGETKEFNTEPDIMEPEVTIEDDITMFTVRMERIRKQLAIKDAQDALMEALDTAIAAEKELGKLLYAIEDNKKHTLTVADYVHGDDADFSHIIDSANIAKAKAVELPNALLGIAADKAQHLFDVMNQSMIGRGLVDFLDRNEIGGSFGDKVLDKIDELREIIEENKSNDRQFTAETPYDVDREDYESAMNENGVIPDVNDASADIEPEF